MKIPTLAACLLGVMSTGAAAQTAAPAPDQQTGWGKQAGSFVVRLAVNDIIPEDTGSAVSLIGGHINVSDTSQAELDLSYFFTDTLAVQLIATATKHYLSVANSVLGPKLDLGSTFVLPPALVLQYHFFPHTPISPYVGVGLDVAFFFAEAAAPPVDKLSLSTAVGPVLNAGIDYNFSGPWFLNLDVKQIFDRTDARVHALGLLVKAHDNLSPTVVSAGIAYRF